MAGWVFQDPEKIQAALRHSCQWCHYIETSSRALNYHHIILQNNPKSISQTI
jgi:hypothetical protein